jgi:hypothetical protein
MIKKVTAAVKKVVAKKVVKKPAVKKASSTAKKTTNKKPLVFADSTHAFWMSDGQILNSLAALEQAFSTMSGKVYGHHVSKDKHDFANWVEVVLCDNSCAADLRKTKSPKGAKLVVSKHLKSYSL